MSPRELFQLAREARVPVEALCSTCGRISDKAEHFDHVVTRLRRPTTKLPIPPQRTVIEWVTVPQIAAELGVSKMTVYRLVHAGEIPSYKVRNLYRVKRTDFDAYLDGTLLDPLAVEA